MSVDPTRKKIRSRLCAREYKTKKQGKIQRAPPASQLFSAMQPLEVVKVLVSTTMSVSVSNKRKGIEVDTLRHQQSISKASAQRLIYVNLLAKDRQKYGENKLVKRVCGTQDASYIWQLGYVN